MAEQGPRRGIVRRTARTLRLKLNADVLHQLHDGQQLLSSVHAELVQLRHEVALLRGQVGGIEIDTTRAAAIARHAYDEEPANRRRLHELRRSQEYELAFTEPEPLVSFLIPTYTSYETLRDVALPSVLGQSYSNLEVIVSGDCAPAETAAAIAEVDDPRVVYLNRTIRGPYPEDPAKRWFGIGGPPFNEALAIARGRWIAILGDDDAVRPNHTADLVAAAQANHWEHCYGIQLVNFPAGESLALGKFPPEHGHWGPQSCIYHSGLRYFESELSDAIYDEPSDWSKCRRMIRAGVRFGMIDVIVADKHETRRSSPEEWAKGEVPIIE